MDLQSVVSILGGGEVFFVYGSGSERGVLVMNLDVWLRREGSMLSRFLQRSRFSGLRVGVVEWFCVGEIPKLDRSGESWVRCIVVVPSRV